MDFLYGINCRARKSGSDFYERTASYLFEQGRIGRVSHRAAYSAFCEAIDRQEEAETAAPKRAYNVTDKAERRAAIALCAYQPRDGVRP
jgi:hypothetical protein